MRQFLPLLFLTLLITGAAAQSKDYLLLSPGQEQAPLALSTSFSCLPDPTGRLTLQDVQSNGYASHFRPLSSITPTDIPVHWVRFSLHNRLSQDSVLYTAIPFTDHVRLYQLMPGGTVSTQTTGDLTPIHQRIVPNGQIVLVPLHVPYGQTRTFYLQLESRTPISQQFKRVTLERIELYSRQLYQKRFVDNRIFQALFYGACLIMLFYNTVMAAVLRSRSYFFYVSYLLLLILFFAANNGYLAEGLLPQWPRFDLYIRFLTTPLLLLFYLLFSRTYLLSVSYAPRLHQATSYILWMLPCVALVMIAGYWFVGRTLVVWLALLSLLLIFATALQALKRGYTPARYFLAANTLLLIGGIAFAVQRVFTIVSNPLTQYGIQVGSVLELALFSLGLAARINLTQKQLIKKQLENERLERQRATELKQLAEEKNRELEGKVVERTAEILAQKEEIQTQNEKLEQSNEELIAAQETIQLQNEALSKLNQALEEKVRSRTQELKVSNTTLQKTNAELDRFIYRTAHDIKGPLARLQGLSYIALMEVLHEPARNYFEKLLTEAKHLNYILARLSTIYDIKHQELQYERIHFKPLLDEIVAQLYQISEYRDVPVEVTVALSSDFSSDVTLIQFIVKTLVENALKFRKPSSFHEAFVSVQIGQAGDSLFIQVTDNGIGIEPANAVHIFDMFSQASRIYRTAGLGLYMTRLSVERLGGNIALVSSTEGLTVFEVRLPIAQPPPAILPAAVSSEEGL